MIFVTLGSQKFQFNRLLQKIDELIENGIITEKVFAQVGYSDYRPKHFKFQQFLERKEFGEIMRECDTVITHGGTGAIIGAVKKGKKVIAVPRLAKYGEHVDDHQLQLLKEFEEMDIILACYDLNELGDFYNKLQFAELKPYQSNQMAIVHSIEEYLDLMD